MGKIIGKSQQVVKTMMNGVKSGKYDEIRFTRKIMVEKKRRFRSNELMRTLWNRVRDGFVDI